MLLLEPIDHEISSPLEFAPSPAEGTAMWGSLRNLWCLVPLVYFATNGNFLAKGEESGSAIAGAAAAATATSRIAQIAIWLLAVLLMYPSYKKILRAVRENVLVSLLIGYTSMSALWSPELLDSLRRGVLLTLTMLFAYFLVKRFTTQELMRLFFLTGCIAVVTSLAAVAVAPAYGRMGTGEWKGIFSHKNDLGIFLCFLLSPVFFMKRRPNLSGIAGVLCALMGVVLIAGSESRGAWVDAAILIGYSAVGLYVSKFTRKNTITVSVTLVAVAGAIGLLIYENYAEVTYLLGKDPTLTNRALIWGAVMASVWKRPIFGFGYGGYWNGLNSDSINVISTVGVLITHAHNGYLNILVQLGFVGLGLFVLASLVSAKNAIMSFFHYRSKAVLWYGSILLLTVVGSADESFLLNYNAATTILFVIACVQLRRIASGEDVG